MPLNIRPAKKGEAALVLSFIQMELGALARALITASV